MNIIIAGRFDTQDQGKSALDALQREGFTRDALAMFYVNPAGQHDISPIGGFEESPGARDADKGAAAGGGVGAVVGAVVGLATVPVAGPAGVVAGAGAGAYTGSLAGALKQTNDESKVDESADGGDSQKMTERQAGVFVAVRLDGVTDKSRSLAIRALREQNASDIEHAQGQIEGGDWADFDPREPVQLV